MKRKAPSADSYAVLTADVVESRRVASFRAKRDRKLAELSKRHLKERRILSPYTVTAWDEFQAILTSPEQLPRVLLDLRRLSYPWQLWIAVGFGAVSEAGKRPVNRYAGGEAFERARRAADRLKGEFAKYRILTSFESGDPAFDTIANTIYHLHDSLLEKTSARQWATINAHLDSQRQELTAKKLGVDISTVSRNLKRGYYWQMMETAISMESILAERFAAAFPRTEK